MRHEDIPELTESQIEACAMWIQEGRDAFFERTDKRDLTCPYDALSIAGRAWDHGWMQAYRDDRDARAMGVY